MIVVSWSGLFPFVFGTTALLALGIECGEGLFVSSSGCVISVSVGGVVANLAVKSKHSVKLLFERFDFFIARDGDCSSAIRTAHRCDGLVAGYLCEGLTFFHSVAAITVGYGEL